MFRALPLEGHKNIIQPAIFGVSRWLPFEGEKRNLSKWFSFDPSRCLPDGREIFKTIHKNRVFVIYPLRKKISKQAQLLTSPSGNKWRNIQNRGKKRVSRCLPFEGTKLFSKHPPKWLLPLGISEEKNNFLEPAHFELSRWLLFEGTKLFRKAPTKPTSPSGNK